MRLVTLSLFYKSCIDCVRLLDVVMALDTISRFRIVRTSLSDSVSVSVTPSVWLWIVDPKYSMVPV